MFTTEQFKEWLRTKDPNEGFKYTNPGQCAYAQFLRANGVSQPNVGSEDWNNLDDPNLTDTAISDEIMQALGEGAETPRPQTFGEILANLEGADK